MVHLFKILLIQQDPIYNELVKVINKFLHKAKEEEKKEEPKKSEEVILLEEIRDLLKNKK